MRRANWNEAASGEAQVVLATRLGVFVPLPKLRLVVVDEEHDDSFKQQDGVRYHARDLAVWRARRRDGSDRPRQRDAFARDVVACEDRPLPERSPARARRCTRALAGDPFRPRARNVRDGISAALRGAVGSASRREQSLVFVNRRGFAPSLNARLGWAPMPALRRLPGRAS